MFQSGCECERGRERVGFWKSADYDDFDAWFNKVVWVVLNRSHVLAAQGSGTVNVKLELERAQHIRASGFIGFGVFGLGLCIIWLERVGLI